MSSTPGVVIADRYTIVGVLGSGGEARVYRARDRATDGEVALRLGLQAARPGPHAIPPAVNHPGWVALLDHGADPTAGAYQVLELLDGRTLAAQVSDAPLTREAWRALAEESLAAIAALHASGLVHGDLNADNFFQLDAPPRAWKLLELPFLRFDAPERSPLFGSIYTLAPEQIDGAAASPASDLFALGCLYYYAAAGRYPHHAPTEAEMAVARLRESPIPLHEFAPGFPAPLADWIAGLLQRRPADRPTDAATALRELLVALTSFHG